MYFSKCVCVYLLPMISNYKNILLRINRQMSDWQLRDCYLLDDMDRLDKNDYFQKQFQCVQLNQFFQQIKSQQHIYQNRKNINEFFDRMLSINVKNKCFYVRLKWLIYFHSILQLFGQNQMMFTYCIKALHVYLQKMSSFEMNLGPFEEYLFNFLLRPYIQYLIKYCSLNIKQQIDKENQGQQNIPIQRQQWYRVYNLVQWAKQNFIKPLNEVKNYFSNKFPYLNKIGVQIFSDLKKCVDKLKYKYQKIDKLNMSLMQLGKLEQSIGIFYQEHAFLITNDHQFIESQIGDFTPAEVTNFFMTPNKPIFVTAQSLQLASPSDLE